MGVYDIGNMLPINATKCHAWNGKFTFFDINFSKFFSFLLSGTWSSPSITDIVEAMNTLIEERHSHGEFSITVKMYRRTQKTEIYLTKEISGLSFFSTDMGHFLGSNVGKEFEVMLRGKGPNKPEFAYDTVCMHSPMIYTNLIEYNIVGDTKVLL